MSSFVVELHFHGDLPFFLRAKSPRVERHLTERTSVKDIVEACGVPHTEVDLILVDDEPVDFAFVIGRNCEMDIYPVDREAATLFPEKRLQMHKIYKFAADGHLGKLVRDLRLLGIDVVYDRDAEDRQLVQISASQDRALLTRDRRLLMHAAVCHGYYLRSQNPLEQTLEVLRRFQLGSALASFSRCLRCNAVLRPVGKDEVLDRLEPLTRIYYKQFRNCSGCGQIYWSGSHFQKLEKRIEAIRSRLGKEG